MNEMNERISNNSSNQQYLTTVVNVEDISHICAKMTANKMHEIEHEIHMRNSIKTR